MTDKTSPSQSGTSAPPVNSTPDQDAAPPQTERAVVEGGANVAGAEAATSEAKPETQGPKVLPTHYRGMPKNWEKNRPHRKCSPTPVSSTYLTIMNCAPNEHELFYPGYYNTFRIHLLIIYIFAAPPRDP